MGEQLNAKGAKTAAPAPQPGSGGGRLMPNAGSTPLFAGGGGDDLAQRLLLATMGNQSAAGANAGILSQIAQAAMAQQQTQTKTVGGPGDTARAPQQTIMGLMGHG